MANRGGHKVERTFTVAQKGEGRPDFSEEIHRGAVMDRIVPKYNEAVFRLGILMTDEPPLFSIARVPLGSGLTYHAIDAATGIVTPYAIPIGYTASIVSYWWAFNQPIEGKMFMDGCHISSLYEGSYFSHYEHDVFEDYNPLDPTGIAPHTLDFTFVNEGDGDMLGYYMCIGKLIQVGTPPFPDTKEVKCAHCPHTHKIDRKLGKVKCPKCGGETTYMPIIFGREL